MDRLVALPSTPAEPILEVYVAAGNLTTVAFNGPLDRDSLVVDRTRFKWADVGDRTLSLEPVMDLGPGERLMDARPGALRCRGRHLQAR